MLRYLVERLPVMITPKWVETRIQPIAIRDVLAYLVGCLFKPETGGQEFDIGGREVFTYVEMMQKYAEVRGLTKRFIIRVPVLTPMLSAYWVDLVTPVPSGIAHPLIEGLRNEVVCKDRPHRPLCAHHQNILQGRCADRLLRGDGRPGRHEVMTAVPAGERPDNSKNNDKIFDTDKGG